MKVRILAFCAILTLIASACGERAPRPTPTYSPSATTAAGLVAEGDARLALSDFAGAEAAYRKAIAADPDFAPAYSHLAYALLFNPATQPAALDEARRATEIAPESAEAWAYLGRAYDWNGRFDEALAAAEKAAQLDPEIADAQSFLGEIYADLRMYPEAVRAAEKAVRLDPSNAEAHRNLGYVYADMSRNAEALAEFQKAHELQPRFVHRLTSLAAHYLYNLDDEATAREWLARAQELAPDDYITLLFLARVEAGRGRTETAVAYCRRILELAPDAPDGHNCLGGVYLDVGDYENAEAERRAAIQADPDDDNAYIGLGYVYLLSGECTQARAQFQKAVDIHPRSGSSHAALGQAYACAGDGDTAEDQYRQAIELEPYNGGHHVRLGRLYLETGRPRDAEREFKKAVELEPEQDAYVAWLGRAYLEQGKLDEALAQYQRAAEIDPEDAANQVALGFVYLNTGRDVAGSAAYFERALEIYEQYGGTPAEIAQANYGLAVSYLARGDCASAIPYLQEAARLDASLSQARDYLRQCTQAVGLAAVSLPPDLTQGGPLGPDGGRELLLNSLSAMGVQAEAQYQTGQDGSRVLVLAYASSTAPGASDFLQERAPVVFAGSWVLARLTPPVDGLVVVSVDSRGDATSVLRAETRRAKLWAQGLLTDAGYAATWLEIQP